MLRANRRFNTGCNLFPIVAAVLKPRAINIALFGVLGAVAGPASVYATTKLGVSPYLSARSLHDFIVAGTVSGAILGIIFGFAIWRIEPKSLPVETGEVFS